MGASAGCVMTDGLTAAEARRCIKTLTDYLSTAAPPPEIARLVRRRIQELTLAHTIKPVLVRRRGLHQIRR
jgi:hypothetical protein